MIVMRVHPCRQPSGSRIRQIAKEKHPQLHQAKYQGVLQADAYAGYNVLYERAG